MISKVLLAVVVLVSLPAFASNESNCAKNLVKVGDPNQHLVGIFERGQKADILGDDPLDAPDNRDNPAFIKEIIRLEKQDGKIKTEDEEKARIAELRHSELFESGLIYQSFLRVFASKG